MRCELGASVHIQIVHLKVVTIRKAKVTMAVANVREEKGLLAKFDIFYLTE